MTDTPHGSEEVRPREGRTRLLDSAEEQAHLARRRTRLSAERTFSSWIRTGLASLAAGLGIGELISSPEHAGLAGAIGVALVLTAGGIFTASVFGFYSSIKPTANEPERRRILVLQGILAAGLLVATGLALALLLRG